MSVTTLDKHPLVGQSGPFAEAYSVGLPVRCPTTAPPGGAVSRGTVSNEECMRNHPISNRVRSKRAMTRCI
jgi:hypothetical protein